MDAGYWIRAVRSLLRHRQPRAKTCFLLDLYPEAECVPVELGTVTFRRSNLAPSEQHALGALEQLRQPATVFEFGTYDGATTLLLARNAPGATVVTIDIAYDTGARFAGLPEAGQIRQLHGDSRTFDFSPWVGTVDLVLVDAGHEYECVAADTETAFRLLAPGGIIVWDDYMAGWPDVVRAVDETGVEIIHLAGTDLALFEDHPNS